jgi:type IV pilus assembly protein PilF
MPVSTRRRSIRRVVSWLAAVPLLALVASCVQVPAPGEPGAAAAPYVPNPQPALETELQYRARLHTELGANYYARGQFDVAIEELTEATRLVPGYAPAYGVLALVQMDLGDFDRADANFARAMQLAPQDPEIRNNYGWYLCHRGREREGLAQFDIALRNPLYRTPELAMLNAGRCHLRLGELRSADGWFRKAQSQQPGNRTAALGLGEIAYREGRFGDAKALIRPLLQSPLPETLLLAGCIDRRLGDKAGELAHLEQLRSLYPDAREIGELASGTCP